MKRALAVALALGLLLGAMVGAENHGTRPAAVRHGKRPMCTVTLFDNCRPAEQVG